MRKAVNDIKRCVACGVCAGQCPRQAIDIYRGCYAVVDVDRCVGCGICESACPAGTIKVMDKEPSTVHERSEWVTVLASDRAQSDNKLSLLEENSQ